MLTAMKLSDTLDALRRLAPEHLAEPWDKVGLHIGDPSQPVRRALLCIDLTEPVMDEAVAAKADLIVAYHPPIFEPVTALTEATWKQRVLRKAIRRNIAIYSPHTALDAARGGMADWLATGLGEAKSIEPLSVRAVDPDHVKIVTFTPIDQATTVRQAMAQAGGGWIGNYSDCSFNVTGVGTFKPRGGARPTIGSHGTHEQVDELRTEMICRREDLPDVLAALREAHPYEEPAIDVLKLEPMPEPKEQAVGAGRRVELARPITTGTLLRRVRERLGVKTLKLGLPPGAKKGGHKVRSIAVCPGAGGSLFDAAPLADAYLTGEMQHHQTLNLTQRGAVVLLAGHTNTERPYLPIYRDRLNKIAKDINWRVSKSDAPPVLIVA